MSKLAEYARWTKKCMSFGWKGETHIYPLREQIDKMANWAIKDQPELIDEALSWVTDQKSVYAISPTAVVHNQAVLGLLEKKFPGCLTSVFFAFLSELGVWRTRQNNLSQINSTQKTKLQAIDIAERIAARENILKVFLLNGVDANAKSHLSGNPVLFDLVSSNASVDLIRTAVKAGADIHFLDKTRSNLLAVSWMHPDALEYFFDLGVDPLQQDNKGYTPLMLAIIGGDWGSHPVIDRLMEVSDFTICNADGHNVFDVALDEGPIVHARVRDFYQRKQARVSKDGLDQEIHAKKAEPTFASMRSSKI